MKSDRKGKPHRIPIKFMDVDPDTENEALFSDEEDASLDAVSPADELDSGETTGGPDTAELIATRAELKRVETENAELKDRLARRQADFENYRKRVDRERSETYNRVVADVAAKLLPVSDNLKRALEAESSVEAAESDEFRHFLSGVDLIWKQLNGVLEALGVKPIPAVGEQFDPHVHEAVVTEATDEYEPDTVIQEIVAGYRLGDKLIRPALVKVATRK
jgi:molecular chaperone GrpE